MVKEIGTQVSELDEWKAVDLAHEYVEMLQLGTGMRVRFFLALHGITDTKEIAAFKFLITDAASNKNIPW